MISRLLSSLRKPGTPISPLGLLILNVVFWLVALVWLTPFLGIFMASVRPFREVILYGWWSLSPFTVTPENYIGVLFHYTMVSIPKGLLNSFIIAAAGTIIPLIVASLAAYGFARFSMPIKDYIFMFILLLMTMPQQMAAIPLFFLLKDLNLLNTYLGLILVHSAWGTPWLIFFFRNYLSLLPPELEEAARVDGATDFQVFGKVVLPLLLPALASAAALQFTWVWGDFFLALVFIYDTDKMVVTQMLPWLRGQYQVDWGLLSAGSILTMLPPLAIYAFLNKYFMRGFTGWAMKR